MKNNNAKSNGTAIAEVTNDAEFSLELQKAFTVNLAIKGTAPLLFHRWSNEDVKAKSDAKKNSATKKTDNIEAYVYQDDDNHICLPSEYIRMSIINSAKYDQHPQKPRASAYELFKAALVCNPELCKINDGVETWDFLDQRRVVIQRAGVTRSRPAFLTGWTCELQITCLLPDLIDFKFLNQTIVRAGMMIGVADFRPSYGRFMVTKYELV